MAGVAPPELTIGEVPVTLVTVPLPPPERAITPKGEAVSVREILVAVKVPDVTNSRSVIPDRLT
jgi:hypothetical protein